MAESKRILVASFNPVKLQAVRRGFARMFPDQEWQALPVAADSGVSDQPCSDAEALQGATNRAIAAMQAHPEADFWVGLEGGVQDLGEEMEAFAWIVVCSRNQMGKARTASLFLPPMVAALVRQGKELGEADDIVFGKTNSKQANGAVGILTGNVVDRTLAYEIAVILALIPFKNPGYYPPNQL